MPKYDFNFSLDAWVKSLEIEADSLEEAKEKLNEMSISDIVDEGLVKDFNIKDLDATVDPDDDDDYLRYDWEINRIL